MNDYLSFRRMITPVFIQIIFWILVVVIVIAAFAQIANDQAVAGILTLILGPLGVRIYAEILMVLFRIHDDVAAIRGGKSSVPAGAPTPEITP